MQLVSEMVSLVKLIVEWIKGGATAEEIAERIQAPSGVGMQLLSRLVERQAAGEEYLGRAPIVRVGVEPELAQEPEPVTAPVVVSLERKPRKSRK